MPHLGQTPLQVILLRWAGLCLSLLCVEVIPQLPATLSVTNMGILETFLGRISDDFSAYLIDGCSLNTPGIFFDALQRTFHIALGRALFCNSHARPRTLDVILPSGWEAAAVSPRMTFFAPPSVCTARTPSGVPCRWKAYPPYTLRRWHLSRWFNPYELDPGTP